MFIEIKIHVKVDPCSSNPCGSRVHGCPGFCQLEHLVETIKCQELPGPQWQPSQPRTSVSCHSRHQASLSDDRSMGGPPKTACSMASAVHKEAKSLGREAVGARFCVLEPSLMAGPFCDPVPLLFVQLSWCASGTL